jgi:hypothetical protein
MLAAALVMVPVALADDDGDDNGNGGGGPTTVTLASGTAWGGDLVCLNAAFPSACPPTATQYGYVGGGWAAGPRQFGSEWIWFSGVSGATAGADTGTASFSRTFDLGEAAISGSISLAADDKAELVVNGQVVGSVGSTTNVAMASVAQSTFTPFDVTAFLQPGENVITVNGANGAFVPTCNPNCTYQQNPAGVVFYGELTFLEDDDGDDDDDDDDDGDDGDDDGSEDG